MEEVTPPTVQTIAQRRQTKTRRKTKMKMKLEKKTLLRNFSFVSNLYRGRVLGHNRGALYLSGENLKVVWGKFSTLSWAVLLPINISAWHTLGQIKS